MLRKPMIVLAMAAALTGELTADAFARGGGGHMGGGFGGHMGGGFGGVHVGGVQMGGGFGDGIADPHFAGRHVRFNHDRHLRLGAGDYGLYDDACDYAYPYYNPYNISIPTDY
jgi:hypothetical protein